MLRPEHCLLRAERLRFALISTRNPVAAARLRNFVEKYRILAERAAKRIDSPPLDTFQRERLDEKASVIFD
jgi:hypothetical protein